ncbi:ComF family protein [Paenibacillus soyae]|uniref:ComF family protein n=1 Tax=Paenibacillus soyae TaxID=2969249 RepID=A0A9X2MTK3_9BACL|nr:hypothetical protein [Paenibacillus soyae]MCR2806741.1 hypothetical protein [Paenibacillus soyae]
MSIIRTITRLLSGLRTAGNRSVTWMAPHQEGCVVCGKAFGQAQPAEVRSGGAPAAARLLNHSLCISCRSSIPWLERILCPICGRGIHCEDCGRRPNRHFVLNRSAVTYDPVMRSWLALYKYRGLERLAPLLAEMLVPPFLKLTEELAKAAPAAPSLPRNAGIHPFRIALHNRSLKNQPANGIWDAVAFVPISAERAEERGFNQAAELARYLSRRYGIPSYDLLVRAHHSEKMSFKSRAERMRVAKSLFEVNESSLKELEALHADASRELRVLLIDDIYTTGSTVEACSEVLLRHACQPLKVYVLTWSRS